MSSPTVFPTPSPVSNAQFRVDFAEFADTTTFPEFSVTYWLNIAANFVNPCRWRTMTILGVELFAAHNLVLEAYNQQTANVGGLPGLNKGAISSESPGSVSVSYDTGGSSITDAGHWNLTAFGTRFIMLSRQFGMGPVQVGIGSATGLAQTGQFASSGNAWPGPGGGIGPGGGWSGGF